jgi:DNA-binding transcriptional LysR family regulator
MHLALMPAGDARFRWRLLSPVYVVAVVSRFHRWSRRATLEIEELEDTPLLLLRRDFGSRGWFDAACQVAHVRPRMLLESSAPATMPILRRGQALGQWASISWDPRRSLAPYAEAFIDELVAYARRTRPWGLLTRRVPPLSRPREPAE